jgi:hypothetical protein
VVVCGRVLVAASEPCVSHVHDCVRVHLHGGQWMSGIPASVRYHINWTQLSLLGHQRVQFCWMSPTVHDWVRGINIWYDRGVVLVYGMIVGPSAPTHGARHRVAWEAPLQGC